MKNIFVSLQKNIPMRKKAILLLLFAVFAVEAMAQAQYYQRYDWPWKWKGKTIVTDTPKRAKGQQHALQLHVAPMDTVRIAFVGLYYRLNKGASIYFYWWQ